MDYPKLDRKSMHPIDYFILFEKDTAYQPNEVFDEMHAAIKAGLRGGLSLRKNEYDQPSREEEKE